MVKVRMLVGLAGADFSVSPGQPYECSAAEAKRRFEDGSAEPWVETAADPKAGVEYRGKRLFGAAAAAVLKRLGRA